MNELSVWKAFRDVLKLVLIYIASKGNHQGKTCLKGEIENSLGSKCVYMWHDIYLLSHAAELLPKQS